MARLKTLVNAVGMSWFCAMLFTKFTILSRLKTEISVNLVLGMGNSFTSLVGPMEKKLISGFSEILKLPLTRH